MTGGIVLRRFSAATDEMPPTTPRMRMTKTGTTAVKSGILSGPLPPRLRGMYTLKSQRYEAAIGMAQTMAIVRPVSRFFLGGSVCVGITMLAATASRLGRLLAYPG